MSLESYRGIVDVLLDLRSRTEVPERVRRG